MWFDALVYFFIQLINYFVPVAKYTDTDRRYRARQATSFLLLLFVVLFIIASYYLAFKPWMTRTTLLILVLDLPMLLVTLGLVMAIKRWQCYVLATHTVLILGNWMVMAAIYYTGGALVSPVVYALILFPVVASLVTGINGGVVWAVLSLASVVLLLLMELSGVVFPETSLEMSSMDQQLVIWLLLLITTTSGALASQRDNLRLTRKLQRERERYEYLAYHDNLTGLANRLMFNDALQQAIARSKRLKHSVLLVYIDLDDFKPINDRFGHYVGDEVLKGIANRLQASVRTGDVVARLGGDEFGIIVEHVPEEEVVTLLDEMTARIRETINIKDLRLSVSASIGASRFPDSASDAEGLLSGADKAMYQAKEAGQPYTVHE